MLGRAADLRAGDEDELATIGPDGLTGWTLALEAFTRSDSDD